MFHFKIWKSTNIFFVKDLLKEDGTFLNVQEFNQKYDIRVQYLEYLGCINVISAYLREHNLYTEDEHFKEYSKVYDIILNSPMRGSKCFKDILLGRAEISNACKNWEKMLGKDIEWTKVFAGVKKKKLEKLHEDGFKQRIFLLEFL